MTDVIVALDYDTREAALELVDTLGPEADFYKVGLELFTRVGPEIVGGLVDRGKRVFLDLKLHDIPNTVAGAVRAAAGLGVDMISVHASGGSAMLGSAAAAAGERTRIVAVTALTSLSGTELGQIFGRPELEPEHEVVRLAKLAADAGAWGAVCSGQEARAVRLAGGPGFGIVTPGIRLRGERTHDQARVMTPADAVRAGANALVVGRTVTRSGDPAEVMARITAEVRGALVESVP